MTNAEILFNHKYLIENDLLATWEVAIKERYNGAGSRATYYNAVRKVKQGKQTTLLEGLSLTIASDVVKTHWLSLNPIESGIELETLEQ